MRIADSLTLPEEVERARVAGELVVFAGAGVSMGEPSLLPDFKTLARKIAGQTVPWSESYERRLDRYLGQAARAGVKVEQRARDILKNDRPHTRLHEHLLGIFGSPERVRLITTNFDRHFTSAADAVFPGRNIPHYIGPALPPGQEFSGIAHLHGALDWPHSRLVLTDATFAEAYMAEGWAARFLVRVFANRTVLFIGYSLGDPLMQYLLHAIPPTGRWFAFWHDEESTPQEHAIQMIPFTTSSEGDRFGDLASGLERWHGYAGASLADHQLRLQDIISAGPPSSPFDADYLRARLATEEGRSLFWSSARDVSWFYWAEKEGFLDELTNPSNLDPVVAAWGDWCLAHFTSGDNPVFLRLLRGRPLTLQPPFARRLHRHLLIAEDIPLPVVRQLVSLLINQRELPGSHGYDWEWLLTRLMDRAAYDEVLAVLRAITRLQLQQLEKLYLHFPLREMDEDESEELQPLAIRVRMEVQPSGIEAFLSKHGQKLASLRPSRMLAIGEQRLREAYDLVDLARGSTSAFDGLSFSRTAISPSGQDTMPSAVNVVITLVRLVLDHWREHEPERLWRFADNHSASERLLFQRLSVFAFARSDASPDEILRRAITHQWPLNHWLRPEFYLLLSGHYKQASEATRQEFISHLRDDEWWNIKGDEHAAHARFSLSKKLLREAPNSPITQEFAQAEDAEHPEWAEGDPDGFLSRIQAGAGVFLPSPIEADQILDWSPSVALENILAKLENGGESAGSLLGALQQAVTSRPAFGVRMFVETLRKSAVPDSIPEAIFSALRDEHPAQPEQAEFLGAVISADITPRISFSLGMLISKWASDLGREASDELLDLFDRSARIIYEMARGQDPSIDDPGWTERALNHPGGMAARIWWRVDEARDWVGEEFVISIEDGEKERWSRILADDTVAGAYARPILGMASDRLCLGDAPWASENLFPAFDPKSGAETAAQLWDGRLMQQRWSWTTVRSLKPHRSAFFRESASLVPSRSRQLGDWVGMLVTNVEQSEITLSELQTFVQYAREDALEAFARSLPRHLQRLTPDVRLEIWRELISPYWRDRCTNMPLGLIPGEVEHMISWVQALPEAAMEVLSLLERSPGEDLEHVDHIIWTWNKDNSWVVDHPSETVRLVKFLADRRSISPSMAVKAVEVLEVALGHGASKRAVLEAAEGLVSSTQAAIPLAARLRDALDAELSGEEENDEDSDETT